MTPLKESLADAMQIMLDTISWTEPEGIKTGYPELDNITRGMRKGSLTVLISGPSLGKTAFALNVVGNLLHGKPEMPILYGSALSPAELSFRLLAILSGVRCSCDHELQGDEAARLTAVVSSIQDHSLYFEDSRTMDDIFFRKITAQQKEKHFGLIVLDPVPPACLSRVQQLARELDIPVLALVSLRKDKSAAEIMEQGDTVIHLTRDRDGESADIIPPAVLVVARNRFGLCGTCRLQFMPQAMQFRAFETESEEA